MESEGPAPPSPATRASLGFPFGVGRCHGNWVGRGWSGRAATTCQEHVLASLGGLWLWLQASDTWILSAAKESMLWGLCSACRVWPPAASLPAGERRDNGMPQGVACTGLYLLTALCLHLCVSVSPQSCFPFPVPLWRQVGNSQSGTEHPCTSSGLSSPLPSYSVLENDLKASCAVSLQCDCWVILEVTEERGDQ